MGSGASSSVRNIHINSSNHVNSTQIKEISRNRQQVRRTFSQGTVTIDKATNCDTSDQEQMLADLKKQVTDTESEKLDLLDRIHLLESQIEYLTTQHQLVSQKSNCEETLHAKDQYISQLEQETVSAQEEVTKLRSKHKKKVKLLSMRLAEAKQETSIQLLELKDDINRLTEENSSLHERLRVCGVSGKKDSFDQSSSQDGCRSKLVLELSQQLNEQNDRIKELETMLRERDLTIRTLQGSPENKPDQINGDIQRGEENGDSTELKSALAEMRSVQRQNKVKASVEVKDKCRGSSGQSRDSGRGSPGESQCQAEARKDRPISASSILSSLSIGLTDSDCCLQLDQQKVRSAPAGQVRGKPPTSNRKKPGQVDSWNGDTEQMMNSVTAKRKKKFSLRQRMDLVDVDSKPGTKMNTFLDSDCDLESELLLESFHQDPVINMYTDHNKSHPCHRPTVGSITS